MYINISFYIYFFRNSCGCEEYPLLKTINRVLRGYPSGPLCSISTDSSGSTRPIALTTEKPTDLREVVDGTSCPDIAGTYYVSV